MYMAQLHPESIPLYEGIPPRQGTPGAAADDYGSWRVPDGYAPGTR